MYLITGVLSTDSLSPLRLCPHAIVVSDEVLEVNLVIAVSVTTFSATVVNDRELMPISCLHGILF